MAKRHVLIDIRPLLTDHISGITVYLEELLLNLAKDKHFEYSLFCNSGSKKSFPLIESFFKIHYTRYPNKIFNLLQAKAKWPLINKLVQKPIDIYLAPDFRPSAIDAATKKIQVVHDLSWYKHQKYFSKKTKLWFRMINPINEINNSNKIVTPSLAIESEFKSVFGNTHSVQHINPFIKEVSAFKDIQLKPKSLFFIGTLEPRKNLETAIKAFQKIHQQDKETEFIIAGIEDKKVFSDNKLQITEGVKFLGRISEEEKKYYLQSCRALVYISHYEGFGLPVAESIQLKTPCLISEDPALKETAGQAGLSIETQNLQNVVEGMKQILYDERTYKKLKEQCLTQAQKWNNQNTLDHWLTLFESVLKKKKQ